MIKVILITNGIQLNDVSFPNNSLTFSYYPTNIVEIALSSNKKLLFASPWTDFVNESNSVYATPQSLLDDLLLNNKQSGSEGVGLLADGSVPMTGLLTLSGNPVNALNPVTKQYFDASNTTINSEIDNIKNYEFKILYYQAINSGSGQITQPANTDIILSDFPSGYDAVVETIANGEPTGYIAKTTGGVAITVDSFDTSGNYTLSDTPSAFPIALLYVLRVKSQYLSNLTFDNIIESQNLAIENASDVIFAPNGDITSTDVQSAIVEVRDDTNTKIANETNARSSADTTLQSNINSEASTRASADTTNATAISNEASTRSSADSSLQSQITTNANAISTETTARTNADLLKEDKANKNQPNGYAGLDSGGRIPSSLLPAGIDEVIEFANFAAFPTTGTAGIIYLAQDTNKQYRWSGSSYIPITNGFIASTDDVPEGSTNLYYTQLRFDSAFVAKSTTNLAEGTNLYYTQGRFNTAFAAKTTDNLSEGTSNLYYTTGRFDSRLATKTTDNLTEGSTNLYFTIARVIASVLTGFVAASTRTAIVATDSILIAFGKIQKYLNDLQPPAFANFGTTTGTVADGGTLATETTNRTAADALLLVKTNNLSDVANNGTSRFNLGVSTQFRAMGVFTTNVTTLSGLVTNDGVSYAAGNTTLLANQTTASQNGPWLVQSTVWTRPTGYPSGGSINAQIIEVSGGTLYAGSIWCMTNTAAIVIDTDPTTWVQPKVPFQFTLAAYNNSLSNATTYYFGEFPAILLSVTGFGNTAKRVINRDTPKIIQSFDIMVANTTNDSSAGNLTISIRLNDTTDYLLSNAIVTSSTVNGSYINILNSSLPVPMPPLNIGDFNVAKMLTPTWGTKPVGTHIIIKINCLKS